jgi:hypothetical protein
LHVVGLWCARGKMVRASDSNRSRSELLMHAAKEEDARKGTEGAGPATQACFL